MKIGSDALYVSHDFVPCSYHYAIEIQNIKHVKNNVIKQYCHHLGIEVQHLGDQLIQWF